MVFHKYHSENLSLHIYFRNNWLGNLIRAKHVRSMHMVPMVRFRKLTSVKLSLLRFDSSPSQTYIHISDRGKTWPPNTPGAREAKGDIQQLTPIPKNNTQGFWEQMHNSNDRSNTKVSTNEPLINLNIPILWEMLEKYHKHGLRIRPSCQTSRQGCRGLDNADRNPRQDQVTMWRVHSPGSTND